MTEEYALDKAKVLDLLNTASPTLSTEEQLHPWKSSCFQSFNLPLLRIWDPYSGSIPDKQNRMSSRAPNRRLDTIDSRKISLATHINHSSWTPTPYISFTSSPVAVEKLAEQRRPRRGPQTLTVIDPNIRLRNGLPILDFAAEMEHYNISNPYGSRDRYCIDHYLCLWQVTENEIIGQWEWDELVVSGNWYQDIVMPAFRDFNWRSSQNVDDFDLSKIMDRLCLSGEPADIVNHRSEMSDTGSEIWGSDDSTSEGFYYNGDEHWGTDDEAEEANAADNIIKVIEGDW